MNEITFGAEYDHVFRELAALEDEAKDIEKRRKEVKAEILEVMLQNNIKAFENDYVKVTLVPETVTIGVDLKAFEFEEPELFEEVAKKFNKETLRKPYVRITTR